MSMEVAVLAIVLVGSAVGGISVLYGTLAKNRWGINCNPVTCPRCGVLLPLRQAGRPTLNQALWGGKTCRRCGTQVDKWGRELMPGNGAQRVVEGDVSEGDFRRCIRRRVASVAFLGYFAVTLLGIPLEKDRDLPAGSWPLAAVIAAAEAAIFTCLCVMVSTYIVNRILLKRRRFTQNQEERWRDG